MRTLMLALALGVGLQGKDDLVGHWKLDEKEGTKAADASGGGRDGKREGGPTFSSEAPPGLAGSLSFDGKDDRVNAGDAAAFVMKTAFTVALWINPAGGDADQTFLNKEGEYEIGRAAGGALQVALANDSPGWSWIDTGFELPSKKWTHVAWTYSAADKKIKVYANGKEVHASDAEGEVADNYSEHDQLWIGARSKEDGCEHFAGQIADVRLYKRALAADAVKALCGVK